LTYYVDVTGGDGRRQQVSKGGFRTRKDADDARVRALSALQNGTWVRPERVTVREFLENARDARDLHARHAADAERRTQEDRCADLQRQASLSAGQEPPSVLSVPITNRLQVE
jgi:hypothetical protein